MLSLGLMTLEMLASGMSCGLLAVMLMFACDGGIGWADKGHDQRGDCE
jgi:hypothetical protein